MPLAPCSGAPATIVVPFVATVKPSWSPAAPSEAVSIVLVVELAQPVDRSVKTNTAPCELLLPTARAGAPTAIVAPDTADE